jgi:predicted O-methyltransferase YrrM
MAFKHWPLVRDVRFAQKCGRFLRGARKRRSDLKWDEFLRIARHFKTDDMGSFPERGYLFQLASDLPAGAKVIEVGSWMGASTCFIAGGLKGAAKIYAVDNFQGLSTCGEDAAWYNRHFQSMGKASTLEIFQRNFSELGFAERAEPVVSDSLAAAKQLEKMKGTIDFIFIDGDHSYDACKADIAAWAPFVKRGGVIAFHDFGGRGNARDFRGDEGGALRGDRGSGKHDNCVSDVNRMRAWFVLTTNGADKHGCGVGVRNR